MEAITELVTTDDNLSPISSGNYPSYSAILARTSVLSQCRTGGERELLSFPGVANKKVNNLCKRGIGNEVCVILLFFSFSYYLEYW